MSEQRGASHDGRFGGTNGTGASVRPTLTEPDIEAAIDTVAREMTDFEPPAAFRAGIMDRIRRRTTPRVSGWRVLTTPRRAWAAAVVVLVLMVASGVWIERGDILPVPDDVASLVVAPPPPPLPATDPARFLPNLTTRTSVMTSSVAPAAQGQRRATGVLTAEHIRTADDRVEMLPALAALEPLQFTHIGPDALDIPAIDVSPLSDIPSLDIPSLNSESTDIRSTDPKKEN